jgi:hypothetical protein
MSFIPSRDWAFNEYCKFLAQLASQRTAGSPPAWPHVPVPAVEHFSDTYAGWYTPYALTLKPHTPLDTLAKNTAKKVLKAEASSFINEYIRYSSKVSAEDKAGLGIFAVQPPSPVPVPATVPVLEPRADNPREVVIPCRDKGSARWGKPKGVHGIEVCWNAQDQPPVHMSELIHSSFDTRSPLKLVFDESDRGKHIFMAGRWEIEREGEKGEFGDIADVFVS